MSFAIINSAIGASGDTWDGQPGNRTRITDQYLGGSNNTLTSLITFIAPVQAVRALVFLKTYTLGIATYGAQWSIQVADNVGFTTNVRTIASGVAPRGIGAFTLSGVVPDNLLAQWCKINVLQGPSTSTDAFTYDLVVDAT